MSDLVGTELGPYQLRDVIGRGGTAVVYQAYQPALDRFVAVKVLQPTHDPQFIMRFKREARAIAQLQHPNILPIYDYGEQGGLLYLVLQYVEHGVTLANLLGHPLAPAPALRLMGHILDALDYAHRRGVVHRDIKPANILMPSPHWPMLADFGIAKLLSESQPLTTSGLIIGTAAYMAPEQAESHQPIDARTDLYSAGVVLYEMLTGQVPFEADTPIAVLTKHVYEPPPPPRNLNPALPPTVEAVLLQALAKDPADRYQSAAEMAAAITQAAAQAEREGARSRLAELYQASVQAFEEGHWDAAVDRLSELVEFDPGYEDAAELLEAARAAQERAREEARRQLEQLRLRRRSTQHPQLQPPPPPPATRETIRLAPDEVALPPQAASDAPTLAVAPTAAGPEPHPPPPAAIPGPTVPPAAWRTAVLWGGGVLVGIALLAIAGRMLTAGPAGSTSEPEATIVANRTAAGPPVASPATAPAAPTVAAAMPTAPASGAHHMGGSAATPSSPGPTAGAELPAPVGAPVFEDDFNSGADKSALIDEPEGAFARGFHSPGVYIFKLTQPNEARWEVLPRLAYRDLSVQIDMWDNSDDFAGSVAQGLIFRARSNDHFHAVLVNPRTGQYVLREQQGPGNWHDLVPWTPSPLIKGRDAVNQLRVDVLNATITVYLNGALLVTAHDDDPQIGMLGMIVANVDARTPHMHFDNLRIWSSDSATPLDLPLVRSTSTGDMVLISGGAFIMGSNKKPDEWAHMVELESFYLDRTEVTNGAYKQCVAAGACTAPQSPESRLHPDYYIQPQYDRFPVIHVTWGQARDFCAWAGKRLPTEAEWEKAASWDPTTRQKLEWPWGNTFDPQRLNSDEAGIGDTIAVGSFLPEVNNTLDLAGNVAEWTSSLYRPYPYVSADGREDPQAPGDRVFRGGSWAQTRGKAKGIVRQPAAATYSGREIGFRCAAAP